jgi:hypothetical protein
MQSDERDLTNVYGEGLLLVRPDQHIAWRGSACDQSRLADSIWSRVLGWPAER